MMILVTGGTGFVGQVLIRHLVALGIQVRTLLRPSHQSPKLPRGVPVEAVICGLRDERGLRAAMKGVESIFHLASAERKANQADLTAVDIEGTRTIVSVAADMGIDHFLYLSHLGADRASAYSLLKTKAIAENAIVQSGLCFTIFRSAILFGPGDHFTTGLVRMLRQSPGFFLLPDGGKTKLQPLWVEDLVTCLTLALDDRKLHNQIITVGGPEFLSFREIIDTIKASTGIRRLDLSIPPAYLRILSVIFENSFKNSPLSFFWQDYLASDRTCDLDTIPRIFGLMPERFNRQLDYLASV